jgi:hypothetical protein
VRPHASIEKDAEDAEDAKDYIVKEAGISAPPVGSFASFAVIWIF